MKVLSIQMGHNATVALANKGEIVGVLGFILTSQYSTSLLSQREAWLAIWKTSPKLKSPGVGVGMLNFLIKTFKLVTTRSKKRRGNWWCLHCHTSYG